MAAYAGLAIARKYRADGSRVILLGKKSGDRGDGRR